MRNRYKRSLVAPEPFFQPVDCAEIKVIGRLVEQQQVRLGRQRAANGGAAFFAAASLVCADRKISTQLVGNRFDFMKGWSR